MCGGPGGPSMQLKKKLEEKMKGEDPFVSEPGAPIRPVVREGRKYRIPFLIKIKRILAGFVFLNMLIVIFAMGTTFTPNPITVYVMWILLISTWLHLDYLWKTRRTEQLEKAVKPMEEEKG